MQARWRLSIVERVKIFERENAFLQHVRAAGVREKKKKKKIQEGRGGEGAKLIRGGESSAREERKREDERELRVFRQLGKPRVEIAHARISSWETCLPLPSYLTLFSFLSRALALPSLHRSFILWHCLLHYIAGPNLSRTD